MLGSNNHGEMLVDSISWKRLHALLGDRIAGEERPYWNGRSGPEARHTYTFRLRADLTSAQLDEVCRETGMPIWGPRGEFRYPH